MNLTKVEFENTDDTPGKIKYTVEPRVLTAQQFKDLLNELIEKSRSVRDDIQNKKMPELEVIMTTGENAMGIAKLFEMNKNSYSEEDNNVFEAKINYLNEIIKSMFGTMMNNVKRNTN